jgi:hypothetical protein
MRTFGLLMLVAGVVGYLYLGSQLGQVEALPPGLGVGEMLQQPAGRLEAGQYLAAFVGVVGLILMMFPKGR